MEKIFFFIVLIFSIVIHEVTHGYVADRLGDPTARLAGRLTLNPIKHIDLVGSILPPVIMILLPGNFIFGWAKPVPYNPYHLKNPERDAAIIAVSGPLSNLFIAAIFGALAKITIATGAVAFFGVVPLFAMIVWVNVILAVFNLVPIPPLDGSKILFALLPRSANNIKMFFQQYGIIIFFFFIFFGFGLITPIMNLLYNFFV